MIEMPVRQDKQLSLRVSSEEAERIESLADIAGVPVGRLLYTLVTENMEQYGKRIVAAIAKDRQRKIDEFLKGRR